MNVLSEIVAHKREEIAEAKRLRPLEMLKQELETLTNTRRPFKELFTRGNVLIAEIKPKSPSAGTLITDSPLEIADLYAKSEADVISVLTDEKYFNGSLLLLQKARARVPQAVLRKDFIVEEYQLYETDVAGADAFLLIAHVLTSDELRQLISLGNDLELDHLVEVHDEKDLEKALEAGAELIGINNRDLKTMKIDIATTEKLMRLVPRDLPVVSESGIESAGDVRKVHSYGVRGILVGTSILQSSDPIEKIKEFKNALHE